MDIPVFTVSTTASALLMPRPSPTMVSMVLMASQVPTVMESQLSTTASGRLRPRPSPTMVSMELMVSQLSPLTDTHLSTTMASALLMPTLLTSMVSTPPTLDTVAMLTPTCTNFAMVHLIETFKNRTREEFFQKQMRIQRN